MKTTIIAAESVTVSNAADVEIAAKTAPWTMRIAVVNADAEVAGGVHVAIGGAATAESLYVPEGVVEFFAVGAGQVVNLLGEATGPTEVSLAEVGIS